MLEEIVQTWTDKILHHRHWPLTSTSFCLFLGQYNDWFLVSSGAGSEGGNLGAGTPPLLPGR